MDCCSCVSWSLSSQPCFHHGTLWLTRSEIFGKFRSDTIFLPPHHIVRMVSNHTSSSTIPVSWFNGESCFLSPLESTKFSTRKSESWTPKVDWRTSGPADWRTCGPVFFHHGTTALWHREMSGQIDLRFTIDWLTDWLNDWFIDLMSECVILFLIAIRWYLIPSLNFDIWSWNPETLKH